MKSISRFRPSPVWWAFRTAMASLFGALVGFVAQDLRTGLGAGAVYLVLSYAERALAGGRR